GRKNYHALDRATESCFHFCEMRGHIQEGKDFFRAAQEQLAAEADPKLQPIWGRILVRSLWMLHYGNTDLGLVETSRVQREEALTTARQQGDKPQTAFCLWLIGALGHVAADHERVIPFLEESLALYTELDDHFYMARAADWLGGLYGANRQQEKH